MEALAHELPEESRISLNQIELFDLNPMSTSRPGTKKTSLGFVYFGEYKGTTLPPPPKDPDIEKIIAVTGAELKELVIRRDTDIFRPDINVPVMTAILTEVFPREVIPQILYANATLNTKVQNARY